MIKSNYRFFVLCFGLLLGGNTAFAISQYACTAWEGMSDAPEWLVKDPQPFIMLRDGDSLHIQDVYNKPITITKFAWHNELINIYKRVDEYGTTSMYYFRHSDYMPDSNKINSEPKEVRLVKTAIYPNWMVESICYSRN